jgi:enoyl-CoA hydratase
MASAFETDWTCFQVTLEDRVAHIRLNRPEAFNSMNRAFWNELPAIVDDISDNARARVIVISSTGRHFTAGCGTFTRHVFSRYFLT